MKKSCCKLIFYVTEDWYFCLHRLPIARAAREAGFEVVVATRVAEHREGIEREGFRLIPLAMRRRSKNPFRELLAVFEIVQIYRRERPDLVHHVSMKPVLYGSLAAWLAGVPAVVNAFTGLGFVFASDRLLAKSLRPGIKLACQAWVNRNECKSLFENPDDQRILTASETLLPERTVLIRGSGVDISVYHPSPEPEGGPIVVTLVARMLLDKGIVEFIEAVRLLKHKGMTFRAILVGEPDPENPASIPEDQLLAWQSEGAIEWWGQRGDIPAVWAQSHIAVLPTTYGEGLPRTLLEAAACARPIIATDVPGCREIVQHESNGLLVPVTDHSALARAIERLISDQDLRRTMGRKGRELVKREFAESKVVQKTLDVYRSMLGQRWPESI
jgi:glycosyltransferase involved in cell wall biosynthesis